MKHIALLTLLCLPLAAQNLAGQKAAAFTLPDSTGKFYDVTDYRGKVVVVDIMKTDCPHCVVTSKNLETVKAKYGDRIQILSIVNPPDSPQTVASYIAKNRITSPILFDCGQASVALLRLTPQSASNVGLPQLILIGPNGVIAGNWEYDKGPKAIFEGTALSVEIDKMLAPRAAPKK